MCEHLKLFRTSVKMVKLQAALQGLPLLYGDWQIKSSGNTTHVYLSLTEEEKNAEKACSAWS